MLTLAVAAAPATAGALLAALHEPAFDDPWDAAAMTSLLASPGVAALTAHEDATPIGFVMLRAIAGEAEILTLAVLPGARRRGVGAALMRQAVETAKAAGARRLFLEAAEDNAAALALYASLGFQAVGRRAGYYRRPGRSVAALILARDVET